MLEPINLMYRLVVDIFLLSCETVFICLQFGSKIELLQNKFDAVLNIFDDIVIGVEEFDVAIIDIVILLQVFLYADVEVGLVYYLDVRHIFVYYVFVDLTDLLTQVEKIFVVVVFYNLNVSTVEDHFPYKGEAFKTIFINI